MADDSFREALGRPVWPASAHVRRVSQVVCERQRISRYHSRNAIFVVMFVYIHIDTACNIPYLIVKSMDLCQ